MFPERFSNLPAYAFPRLRALLDSTEPGGPVRHMSIGEPKHPYPLWISDTLVAHAHEFAKYPLYPGFHSMPVIEVSINKDIYDSLPEDLQTILNESVSVFARDMVSQLDEQNQVAVAEAMADPDITVIN